MTIDGFPPQEGKYAVAKLEDAGVGYLPEPHLILMAGNLISDCVVLRLSDRFAASAIRAYADAVINAIEVTRESGVEPPPDLLALADEMVSYAEDAEELRNRGLTRTPD